MNEANGSKEPSVKTAQAADELAFQSSLFALSAAVESAAARRALETAAEMARLRKRENNL